MPNGETRMANLMAKILQERRERIKNGGPKVLTKQVLAEKNKRGRPRRGQCGTTAKGDKFYCLIVNPVSGHRLTCGKGFLTRAEAEAKAIRIGELRASGIEDWEVWKQA